jgi:hypothetical protein
MRDEARNEADVSRVGIASEVARGFRGGDEHLRQSSERSDVQRDVGVTKAEQHRLGPRLGRAKTILQFVKRVSKLRKNRTETDVAGRRCRRRRRLDKNILASSNSPAHHLSPPVLCKPVRRLEKLGKQRVGGFVYQHLEVLHRRFVVEIERKLGLQLQKRFFAILRDIRDV